MSLDDAAELGILRGLPPLRRGARAAAAAAGRGKWAGESRRSEAKADYMR